MLLKNINHAYGYHTQKIVTLFFPLEKIQNDRPDSIEVITEQNDRLLTVTVRLFSEEKRVAYTADEKEDMAQAISLLLYNVLAEMTGFRPPWGILYGVRPARLMHAKTEQLGEAGAKAFFKKSLVTDSKIDLAVSVMHRENKIIALSQSNSYSLYVSIPFCPSRCSYCSFVSHSIQNAQKLIDPYVDLLCRELAEKAALARQLGLRLETVYFGGGTPTTLTAAQLDRLLTAVEEHFDLTALREYTVEAGRPDTVTADKLLTLQRHRVGRISINPQSFNDEVLQKICRRHTVAQVEEAFALARSLGFDNINMDLIAGLNGDTLPSFCNSVDRAVAMGAESVTVHNLALKSAAYLVTENEYFDNSKKTLTADMINYSNRALSASGYAPYYMYRQSKSLGNLENCGWCREGFDCLYNVFMMDETHTVLAAGAGAVTKLKHPQTGHIERIYNYKYPYEYLRNFETVLEKQKKIIEFYNS
ncbi:MAG: coproporphyrinogen dehydrogenase HemZ [Eubacterium sp.]|nr:coproporphyrinogen dehydrogenase HemZ [Eubacterium sp.]